MEQLPLGGRSRRVIRRLTAAIALLAVAACGSIAPSPSPSPSPSAEGFYLRAWVEQALPPQHTFAWLPNVTIADGVFINGVVAVPAIFPGPLVVMPNARAISASGQLRLIADAGQLGLLGGQTDFTGGGLAPGAPTGHIELIVDGATYRLTGDPGAPPAPEPGTARAFSLFWQRVATVEEWQPAELGPLSQYVPERVAVAFVDPQPAADVPANRVAWPLDEDFASTGQAWVVAGGRCATFSGDDLEVLRPVLSGATQIDVFVDGSGVERGLIVRPLVPGEPSPCPE